MSPRIEKRYLIVGRERKNLEGEVRTFLASLFKCTYTERRVSGGQSGDLYEETAQIDTFSDGNSTIQLYVMCDHSTFGYAISFSVLTNIDPSREQHDKLFAFLDAHEFVNRYSSFKDRPG